MNVGARTLLKIVGLAVLPLALGGMAPPDFSFVLTTSEEGVAATCTSGCAWQKVSANFPGGRYRISEHGIEPAGRPAAPGAAAPSRFSIVLSAEGGAVSATCEQGCAWKTLSARYPGRTFEITDAGIRSGQPTR